MINSTTVAWLSVIFREGGDDMKKIAAVVVSALAIMSLAACGSIGTGGPSKADTQSETKEAPKKAPLDLTKTLEEK
jgi:uncharacterized lipoprotein